MFTPLRFESSPIGSFSARESVMTRIEKPFDPVATTGCIFHP